MFLAPHQHPASLGYDCIVVGSGPAGLTVATELEQSGRRILLLESESGNGDLALSVGYGHFAGNYWNAHWIRAFGGTSNAWAGWVSTLREIDFDHPTIGVRWPIGRPALVPFYKRAAPIIGRRTAIVDFERPVMSGWLYHPFSIGDPTRFGEAHRDAIARSTRLDVALGYSVVGLGATPSRTSISAVHCFDHRQRTAFTMPIGPRQSVVVAAGGIGNAQLLLQPSRDGGVPVGNESGLVGTFLMEHPHAHSVAECVTTFDPVRYAPPGGFGRRVDALRPDETLEREHNLYGCSLELRHRTSDHDLARALSRSDERLYHYDLTARSEMQPSASNQVFLTAERDRAGLFQAGVRCVLSASDQLNIERTVRLLGETFLKTGRGRVRVNNDALYREATGGGHIMGTTRMGSSRADSVVDRNCRVHGYGNFFVAGSSVFPTGGFANPTFTIVALAVRLADEIARRG